MTEKDKHAPKDQDPEKRVDELEKMKQEEEASSVVQKDDDRMGQEKEKLPDSEKKVDELDRIKREEEALAKQKGDVAQKDTAESDSSQAANASGTGDGTSIPANRNTRAVSLPGAFRIDHPDASAAEELRNTRSDYIRRTNNARNDDEEDAVFIVPTAVRVHENAAVTYASELVEAAPMPSPSEEEDDETTQATPEPPTPRDSVVIKRRHVKIFVLLVTLIVVGLLVSLTAAMVLRKGDGKKKKPKKPPPAYLRSPAPGPAPTYAAAGGQPTYPPPDCNNRRLGDDRYLRNGGRCGQGKKNCNDRRLGNGGGGGGGC